MIPNVKLTGASLDAFFVYIFLLGILLAVATQIRLKVPILKKYHVPASLLAGFIGLILGPHFLKVIPAQIISCWSSLSGRLIVLIFTPLLMTSGTHVTKKLMKKVVGAGCYAYGTCFVQYAIPMLLSLALFIPLFHVDPLFSVIVEEGWIGGHGTAGGMAAVFEELGWNDGISLSVTSATIGLVYGILGGMVLINVAVKKGWTAYLHKAASLSADQGKELYPKEERPVDTHASIKHAVLDNLAFHLSIISIAAFLGYLARVALKQYLHVSISWYVTSMFAGFLLKHLVLDHTAWKDCMDKATINRIQGVSLEFLVAGAVSAINVPVVVAYAVPLLIQQGIMAVVTLWFTVWYCRRIFGNYWFENSMLYFGMYTGVFATGMLLLKTCDPELKSGALELDAIKSPFTGWAIGGGLITGMMPYWVMQYGLVTCAIVTTVLSLVVLTLPKITGCWFAAGEESSVEATE